MAVSKRSYKINSQEIIIECDEDMHNILSDDHELLASFLSQEANENDQVHEAENLTENLAENNMGTIEKDDTNTWNVDKTKLLIATYASFKDQFRDPKRKKKDLWNQIVAIFRENNYSINAEGLDRKWRNLKKRYTTIKDTTRRTGRGRISWEFYAAMDDIYRNDNTINIPPTISSLNCDAVATVPEAPMAPTGAVAGPSETPVAQCTITSKNATNMRGLYGLRKRLVEIEEKRVEEIKQLKIAVEASNAIQAERNEILKQIADKL